MDNKVIKTCRCPACNPMHGSGKTISNMSARRFKNKTCGMCQNTKLVSIDIAEKYVSALQSGIQKSVGFSPAPKGFT
jgi:hypothetical protein